MAPLFSSANQTWNTPSWFIERVVRSLGPIGLDPCSNGWSTVGARVEFHLERGVDGLLRSWNGYGLVFVNPPFGRVLPAFSKKWSTEGDELIALVPGRVDTEWWHRAARRCAAFVHWRGRFKFSVRRSRAHGNAPFPTSVLYYGARRDAFLDEFARNGIAVRMPSRKERG